MTVKKVAAGEGAGERSWACLTKRARQWRENIAAAWLPVSGIFWY
jgi:hypothetical protein